MVMTSYWPPLVAMSVVTRSRSTFSSSVTQLSWMSGFLAVKSSVSFCMRIMSPLFTVAMVMDFGVCGERERAGRAQAQNERVKFHQIPPMDQGEHLPWCGQLFTHVDWCQAGFDAAVQHATRSNRCFPPRDLCFRRSEWRRPPIDARSRPAATRERRGSLARFGAIPDAPANRSVRPRRRCRRAGSGCRRRVRWKHGRRQDADALTGHRGAAPRRPARRSSLRGR